MKKHSTYLKAALLLFFPFALAGCGSEPASDNLQPEATQGDYLGDDDLSPTDTSADMPMADTTAIIE